MCNRKVAVLVAALLATPAWANESAQEIARINEENAVISARLQKLSLETQVAAKQAELAKLKGETKAGGTAVSEEVSMLPVIRAIEGADGRLKATLAIGGGVLQTVSQGEKIRGGWTVAEINVNAVTLARNGERVRLGFGSEPPASKNANGQPQQGFPGLPGQAY